MSTQYGNIGRALPLVGLEEPSVLKRLGNIDGLRCLDLACGFGYWSLFLIRNGAAKVVGVDISEEMVKAARQGLPEEMQSKVVFHVKDCSKPISIDEGPVRVLMCSRVFGRA